MILKTVAKTALLAAFLTAPAQADERWAISKLTYENHGDYEATFAFRYEFNGGKGGACELSDTTGNPIQPGESVTIHLDNSDGSIKSCDIDFNDDLIGTEIYGIVYIESETDDEETRGFRRKNCRKFGTRFHWDPNGGTAVVKSGGTSTRSNRCKLVDKGGVTYTGERR